MFCVAFGTYNSVVAFILGYDPKKGQGQVKLGQISKLKLLAKHTYYLGVSLRLFFFPIKIAHRFYHAQRIDRNDAAPLKNAVPNFKH